MKFDKMSDKIFGKKSKNHATSVKSKALPESCARTKDIHLEEVLDSRSGFNPVLRFIFH